MGTQTTCVLLVAASFIVVFRLIQQLLDIIYTYGIARLLFSKRKQLLKAGEWAIVTGATSGIGEAFANELAKDGLNIFLLSRSEKKLQSKAAELERLYHIQTKYLAVDFTKTDIYDVIKKELDSLSSIACLVNNVGMVNQPMEDFAEEPSLTFDFMAKMLHCNILSAAGMTRIVLPKMICQRSGAAIINMSSASSQLRLPFLTFYASSKAWMSQFSSCLQAEVSRHNVLVQSYHSMYVSTELFGKTCSFFVPSAQTFVRSALNMLGVKRDLAGYWPHELELYAYRLTPQPFMTWSLHREFLQSRSKTK